MITEILPDIPRFYTAFAEWLACLICLLEVKKRMKGKKFIAASLGFLFVQSVFLVLTPGLEGVLWVLCMAAAIGFMYGYIFLCANIPWKDAAYFCIRAFVLAEFAASLEWQLDCYASRRWLPMDSWKRLLIFLFIFAFVYGAAIKLYHSADAKIEELAITSQELSSYLIIGIAIFVMSNLGFVSKETLFGGTYSKEIFNVRTLVDFGGVAIMYAYHIQRVELRVHYELDSVQRILHNQYVQYKQAREAMDVINYEYHDLKHHLIALRAEENVQKRNEYIDQLESELQNYEAQNKTGSKTLDVMLTTKGLYCKKHGITLTCVVDGAPFDFMKTMDICSIFGNALDNAIECELKIPDKEKRLIHVSAYSKKNFLIIHFENYYEGEILLGSGLPATTKKDAKFHGYGLKSLRYTVTKYGGAVDLSAAEQWFHLKILIPIQEPLPGQEPDEN